MDTNDRIFVAGSKVFDITQFYAMKTRLLCNNEGIQSESFTLGGYDWVIQFYPKGMSNSTPTSNTDNSKVFFKVLNATEECWVVCTIYQWNWTTSQWEWRTGTNQIALKPSGNMARHGISYSSIKDLENSKYVQDSVMRTKFNLLVTPRPPAPAPPLKAEIDKPAGANNQENPRGSDSSFDNGFHLAEYAPPNGPNNTKMPRQPTVRLYCQANDELSVTARNGTVVLAPADPNDHYQHWIKDMSYGDKVKDASGLPAFALVNRVTGEALKNPAGENEEVSLVPYNPNSLEDSVKWTEVRPTGFRAIRIADTTSLNLTAIGSDDDDDNDNDTNFYDGSRIIVMKWVNSPVQRWKIVPNVPC